MELMVSLGVVAVLVAVAVPTVSSYLRLAHKVECQTSIIFYLRAQNLYHLDNDTFYDRTGTQSWDRIAWDPSLRPDQTDRYRFPELGVEFRPDKHRGYRIRVINTQLSTAWFSYFNQELSFSLRTDEDFDRDGQEDIYQFRKYNTQWTTTWAWTAGTSGEWYVTNPFWFPVDGVPATCCYPRSICGCTSP